MAAFRFGPNGGRDTVFGAGGVAVASFPTAYAEDVALDGSKIVVAGEVSAEQQR